ncbi:helix-turn-helix transcriptional regulator [Priestia megaterium]|uniref:helix-turn-helix transcriptional regulator n=1 Tax=Priestia megaterium TaxID=1404 RepID=UPI0020A1FD0C|nr:AraC family transcriptional regulator [Priestia megaterium]MCP1452343.1 AraC-like DNA-binding protein/mannose-6-phosphate isomerase-like protein (cupin superfamily) [Priestia megaterium]
MVQSFVKKKFIPTFENGRSPKLLYVCKAEADHTKLPCVMHVHQDRLEILYIRQGRGIHTIGGRQYHTKQGDVLIYNSGVIHDERTNPEAEMSVYSCGISDLKLEGMRKNCLLPDGASPVLFSDAFSQDIENLFCMMYSQICSENAGAEEISHHLLQALIIMLVKQINRSIEKEEDKEVILGERIRRYIDDHYSENHTLESISETLNISLSYLCHVFKETTGYAPMQYIMRRRIGEAQSLLINTQYSATQIASMVGYNNSNYFNTIFTRIVGMSPIKYRKCWVDQNSPKRISSIDINEIVFNKG